MRISMPSFAVVHKVKILTFRCSWAVGKLKIMRFGEIYLCLSQDRSSVAEEALVRGNSTFPLNHLVSELALSESIKRYVLRFSAFYRHLDVSNILEHGSGDRSDGFTISAR
jgi:hypothetical protein